MYNSISSNIDLVSGSFFHGQSDSTVFATNAFLVGTYLQTQASEYQDGFLLDEER